MRIRRKNYAFLFSVEGDTEKWYLEHLQELINDALTAKGASFTITLNAKVEKKPLSYIKTLTPGVGMENDDGKTIITHLFDYEAPVVQQAGMNPLKQFQKTLKEMREAENAKNIEYCLAYSNLSFDLWIILHKQNCNGFKTVCNQYLPDLNQAYRSGKKTFTSMHDYKAKKNFGEVLSQITLSDVHSAINRAENIIHQKHQKPTQYCGYDFFTGNPSLSLHERIQDLFNFCKDQGCAV